MFIFIVLWRGGWIRILPHMENMSDCDTGRLPASLSSLIKDVVDHLINISRAPSCLHVDLYVVVVAVGQVGNQIFLHQSGASGRFFHPKHHEPSLLGVVRHIGDQLINFAAGVVLTGEFVEGDEVTLLKAAVGVVADLEWLIARNDLLEVDRQSMCCLSSGWFSLAHSGHRVAVR